MHLDNEQYEEGRLLALLVEGSEYAFGLIFDRYRNRIYQTGLRYLKSPMIAQEVVQDVFMKLWFKRTELQIDQPIEAWLHIVARNNILNRLKRIANERKALKAWRPGEVSASNEQEDLVQLNQYRFLLAAALNELSEQQRKIFEMARFQEKTYAEIGKELHLSPFTVKTHMSRALQTIRKFFELHGEVFPLVLLGVLLPMLLK